MSALPANNLITADGDYDIPVGPANRRWLFSALGTFGSGTITLKHGDGTNFATFKDANGTAVTFTAAGGVEVTTPWPYIRVSLAGATAPSISIACEPID